MRHSASPKVTFSPFCNQKYMGKEVDGYECYRDHPDQLNMCPQEIAGWIEKFNNSGKDIRVK